MEEKLVIDRPYPGLQVFDSTECLQYFTKETILAKYLGSTNTEHSLDKLLFSQIHHLVNEPKVLFYLMSVCPEEKLVEVCCRVRQQSKQFHISAFHVVHVFLNWGATPEGLGIQDDLQLSSSLKPALSPTSMSNFPGPCNIKAVLDEISKSLYWEKDEISEQQSCTLVRVLMKASLDERMRPYRFKFQRIILHVLETFSVWNIEKLLRLVGHLPKMSLQNAAFVCCSLFVTSPRFRDFKVVGIRSLLHSRFNLPLPTEPLESLLLSLSPPEEIMERFQLLDIYVLIQLLDALLITLNYGPASLRAACVVSEVMSKASIEGLLKWTEAVHSKLMVPTTLFAIEGGIVREKCVRLRADCKELLKNNK